MQPAEDGSVVGQAVQQALQQAGLHDQGRRQAQRQLAGPGGQGQRQDQDRGPGQREAEALVRAEGVATAGLAARVEAERAQPGQEDLRGHGQQENQQ